MSERDAFVDAIVADPDDDTHRLVFADWLDERDDPADRLRAEFIRLQCRLGPLDRRTCHTRDSDALRARESEILARPEVLEWLGTAGGALEPRREKNGRRSLSRLAWTMTSKSLPGTVDCRPTFERGFVSKLMAAGENFPIIARHLLWRATWASPCAACRGRGVTAKYAAVSDRNCPHCGKSRLTQHPNLDPAERWCPTCWGTVSPLHDGDTVCGVCGGCKVYRAERPPLPHPVTQVTITSWAGFPVGDDGRWLVWSVWTGGEAREVPLADRGAEYRKHAERRWPGIEFVFPSA